MAPHWSDDPRQIPNLEFVQSHLATASAYVAAKYTDSAMRMLKVFPVESPIEAVFYVWWLALLNTNQIREDDFVLVKQVEAVAQGKKYRLDFAIEPDGGWLFRAEAVSVKWPQIAIELDGHDFHERTKDQVIYRNERDRALQSEGWMVLHFSGTELNRDPHGTVLAAYGQAFIAHWRFQQAVTDTEYAMRRATEGGA